MKAVSLLGVVFWIIALTGCNINKAADINPQETMMVKITASVAGENISLTTEDNIRLDGNFYQASGEVAVVLAHMGIADQTAWSSFAADIAKAGMAALTFDFRCFGKSECTQGISTEMHLTDLLAAIHYLQTQGYQRIVCMGASMGATACLQASMQEDLAGMVFIAGDREILLNGKWYPDDLVSPAMPKLFIVAEQDPYSVVVADTQRYYNDSPEPRQLIIYPEAVHGTDLFDTPSGEKFHQALMDFLLAIR
jgi:pimeloyl-ACP methyl ester carboxylesterase